ncbi:MAG TPA: aminoacetone oxidase family FAD-binding enzyme, partial [Elusimicrobia bacterium]|nr:aminoacetone oxidase family FAD-binding enzyme [Elusimicrobiota bacterium]
MKPKVAVIGGGASGLAAAIGAARGPADVTILERGHSLGRKILASGGGRCNLSHSRILPQSYHGARPAFIRDALARFKSQEAVRFFSELGLLIREEPDGRIFPRCGKAQAVLDVLKTELERLAIRVCLGRKAVEIRRQDAGFLVRAEAVPWKTETPTRGGEEYAFDRVILACGGASYPQLGAGEAAYDLGKSLGHAVTGLTPALVPLCVKESAFKRLHGLRLEAGLRVLCGEKEISRCQGEILFTDYGISGPAALDISRDSVKSLARGRVQGSLNLFPEFSSAGFHAMIKARWTGRPKRLLKDFFMGMFPVQLAGTLMDTLGWEAHRPLDSLGRDAVDRLAALLQDWRFEIIAARPWSEAMVTAGGIDVDAVDAHTFESRKVRGLFLAGEMLDVDGDSGGFNLHFAWASGLA